MAAEKNERPTGIQERMLYALEMIETYLGLIAGRTHQEAGGIKAAGKAGKAETASASASASAAAPEVEPTADEVREALKNVAENFGREAAIKLLKDNGHKNASAVPAAERAGFIAKCLE